MIARACDTREATCGQRSSAAPSTLVVDVDFAPALTGLLSQIREAVGIGTADTKVRAANA